MFRPKLGRRVLVFCYAKAAPRLFHTFFCPRLRVLALNDAGEIVYDRVVSPCKFVPLPSARLIVECDPGKTWTETDWIAIAKWLPAHLSRSSPQEDGPRPAGSPHP